MSGVLAAESEELVRIAVTVGTEAAELVRNARSHAVTQVDTKSSETDVVTAADRASEQLVRDRLAHLRPGEPVLGEEEGGADSLDGLVWVVDPIDGTVNYLYGLPFYAVSIAAQLDGVSVAGAVVEPVSGRIWTASRGGGSFCDGRPLRAAATTRLELSLLGTGFSYDHARRLRQADAVNRMLGRVRDIRRCGAASLDLCAVAAGWEDAYIEHGLHRWDWAAGGLIAEEAGAVVRFPGSDDDGLGPEATFAAAPAVADQLRAALVESGFGKV
ncbi:inositol monophosphatase family protein [Kutzneria sp. NPDC051319]|uniref:inositol monophosphatase family protein n=1 Tax=Kutzneria sp. NPDC051319 TaxID=3155047 RepID=UPI003427113C